MRALISALRTVAPAFFAAFVLLSAGAARANDKVLCVLPRVRRAEIARELAIEWAGRQATIEVVQGPPPDVAALVETAHEQGASAVLMVRLPDGALGGIEIRYITTADGRERRAILHEAYDAIDARAFAIATRDLVRSEEPSTALEVADSGPVAAPPPAPPATCPEVDTGPRAFTSFYAIGANAWLPARGVAPFGYGIGFGQSTHWATGHGFRIEVVWSYGNADGDIGRWTTTPTISLDYSFRLREQIAPWFALAWSSELGAAVMAGEYWLSGTGPFTTSPGSTSSLGLEVGTGGDVVFGSFVLGLAFRWKSAVAFDGRGPSGNAFVHQVQLQLHAGFEFSI